eukprot:m.47268 g.47268  ORF g.47268 m.47268 type:complete len:212 (-) comp5963_c0_seq3:240-875(-)
MANHTHSRRLDSEIADSGMEDPVEQKRLDKMKGAVRTILECIGEDTEREGLIDTPARLSKALLFLSSGYQESATDVLKSALFDEPAASGIVIVKDIEFFSLCEHHMLPFHGQVHIGYYPGKHIVGLSKFGRMVNVLARRLQVQERLTEEIAAAVMEALEPRGVIVVAQAGHMCMAMRGVQKTGSQTVTMSTKGIFATDQAQRAEFMAMIKL